MYCVALYIPNISYFIQLLYISAIHMFFYQILFLLFHFVLWCIITLRFFYWFERSALCTQLLSNPFQRISSILTDQLKPDVHFANNLCRPTTHSLSFSLHLLLGQTVPYLSPSFSLCVCSVFH